MDDWVELADFPGNYVNRAGQVKHTSGTIHEKKCHIRVKHKDGNWMTMGLHVLVARTFIPNPLNLPEVDHLDHTGSAIGRVNNAVENLRWISVQDNRRYAQKMFKKSGLPRGVKELKRARGKVAYAARVSEDHKSVHLGTFTNIFDAELCRLNYEYENWGPRLMTFERRYRREKMLWVKRCIAAQRARQST